MVPSAINGGLYRDVHDFDIIVLPKSLPELLLAIYALGYTKRPLNFFRVSELMGVYVFSHPTLLDIGFFVISEEASMYTVVSGPVRVEIPPQNLVPRTYKLGPYSYPGIDPSFAYALCLLARDNPKRKKELELYRSHHIIPAKWPIYTFRIGGYVADWVVDLLDSALAVIGRIRTKFGLTYDPWQ